MKDHSLHDSFTAEAVLYVDMKFFLSGSNVDFALEKLHKI